MKRIILGLIALIAATAGCFAHPDAKTDKWMREMNQARRSFIAKELNLTEAQQTRFFAQYDAMDNEVRSLYDNLQRQEKALQKKGEKATDAERVAVAEGMFEAKAKEGAIELKYYKKFKEILSPKQLLKLKSAERDFRRKMTREHRKLKKKK